MQDSGRELHDVVVVGGGIAGLTAAWHLRDKDVVLLESDARVGGRIFSEPRGSYWLNLGAHLFPPPSSAVGSLATEMGLSTEPIPGDRMAVFMNGKIVAGGSIYTYPFRLPLSVKGRLSLIRAGLMLQRATRQYFKDVSGEPGPEGRMDRLRWKGDRSFAKFLGGLDPDVEGLMRVVAQRLTAPMEDLSAGSGITVVGHAWAAGAADEVRNMRGGSNRLPQAIARTLGERVLTGAEVTRVAPGPGGVRVGFRLAGREREVTGRVAIVATPADVTARITEGIPADTRAALEAVRYGPFVIGGILTGETGPMPWDDLYAMAVVRRSFNMLFNVVNIAREKGRREPGGSLMVYGGGEAGQALLDKSDDEIREVFLRDLYEIYPVARGLVREVMIRKLPHAMPYVWPGRHRIQPALEKPLGDVFLAGDYLEWAHMEAAVTTAAEAAGKARRRLEEGAG